MKEKYYFERKVKFDIKRKNRENVFLKLKENKIELGIIGLIEYLLLMGLGLFLFFQT